MLYSTGICYTQQVYTILNRYLLYSTGIYYTQQVYTILNKHLLYSTSIYYTQQAFAILNKYLHIRKIILSVAKHTESINMVPRVIFKQIIWID